jgi:hypothetical protein
MYIKIISPAGNKILSWLCRNKSFIGIIFQKQDKSRNINGIIQPELYPDTWIWPEVPSTNHNNNNFTLFKTIFNRVKSVLIIFWSQVFKNLCKLYLLYITDISNGSTAYCNLVNNRLSLVLNLAFCALWTWYIVPKHVGDTYLIFMYIKYCAFGWCNKLDTVTKITVCILVYSSHILCHECHSSGSQWISPQRPVQFCG